MSKATDWVKWGSIAGLATVVVTLIAIYVSHSDQRDAVYVTINPLGWKREYDNKRGYTGTIVYNITVTGKSPARNVELRDTCMPDSDPTPPAFELSPGSRMGDLPPGATQKECSTYQDIVGTKFDAVFYAGKIYYEDDRGSHSYSFCFQGGNIYDRDDAEYYPMRACQDRPNFKE